MLKVSGNNLVSLQLEENDSLTGDQFHMFEDKFASLKKLVCSRCNGLSDENLCILLRCLSKIESLDLGYSSFKGEKLTDFQTEWSNLENVDLSLCENLTDEGLTNIFRISGNKLKSVTLNDCNITAKGLLTYQEKLTNLEELSVRNCLFLRE